MNYEEQEAQRDKIREENEKYLKVFEEDAIKEGLTEKTIEMHIFNVDFYINTFLLRNEARRMHEGCNYNIDSFLGFFFIRKCTWSTPGNIKTTATSIKKFYKSMLKHQNIEQSDYDTLCRIIKEEMANWQQLCADYNNPDMDSSIEELFDL